MEGGSETCTQIFTPVTNSFQSILHFGTSLALVNTPFHTDVSYSAGMK